jgi:hypothetical protein
MHSRTTADEQIEAHPKDATHWSRASMAAVSGLLRSTIGRIGKDLRLKPYRAVSRPCARVQRCFSV